MRPTPLARLQLLGAAVLFSTGGAAIKAADLTSWQVASFRSGVAALAMGLLVPAAWRGWTWRTAAVGASYAATLTLFVLANKLTTAANTIFLQSAAPLYILLLGPWLLKEPIRPVDLLFMAIVGLGLALFFLGAHPVYATAPDPIAGNALATLSGVFWALTIIGFRWIASREGERDGGPARAVVLGNLIAFAVNLAPALPLGPTDAADWLVVGYLGVFQIAAAYVLVTAAISRVPALEASVLLLAEPALNPIWAWLVQGERPGARGLLGGGLILGATLARTWYDARVAERAVRREAEAS
ncbi:MAG TPA: DMT family transporter [Gemmatimonadales bacterium]|nr:DMT family transporter [Gemmatimonadales bacterium]